MNEDKILDKVDEIITYIKNTNDYKNYIKAKKKLESDEEVLILVEKVKKYQKEIVRNKGNKEELEKKINACLEKLNNSVIYTEFLNYQSEVNNMLTIFENKLNKYFHDVFN